MQTQKRSHGKNKNPSKLKRVFETGGAWPHNHQYRYGAPVPETRLPGTHDSSVLETDDHSKKIAGGFAPQWAGIVEAGEYQNIYMAHHARGEAMLRENDEQPVAISIDQALQCKARGHAGAVGNDSDAPHDNDKDSNHAGVLRIQQFGWPAWIRTLLTPYGVV